ncbi:MAG: agmatine deiminase [Lachnospiraceae bacterium]
MINKYQMPAEFERHRGTILIWPTRPGSWGINPIKAQQAFIQIASEIAKREELFLIASKEEWSKIKESLPDNVNWLAIETNDSWARDIGPTFVREDNQIKGIDWKFNAWGGEYNGLYEDYEEDDAFASIFCKATGYEIIDKRAFVLEGGAIHSDGEGTILVTSPCLLSKGRNPHLSKEEIEKTLCEMLGGEKVLWLPHGIYLDETDEHVDNICAFIKPAELVLAWSEDKMDPQYEMSKSVLEYLENETDAKGRKFTIHKLHVPTPPILLTKEDCLGYSFEEGEATREVGERMAASYVNFYFINDGILLPVFGGEHKESDEKAIAVLKRVCPDREIIPIYAKDILLGGGNIHCITQQIPQE